ncbi:hypothetical protein P152DRAFT_467101 [Eremomyces bilateralis CBS 781.70]|uniref:Autophagy-related protein 27 n=1 Tax=Eremomyces bilateralis CBS 781.70 TaxID=1392243 RepID=A0A6G1G0K1_9PEZI|nr:uncharacterized protein P152DRAFT_467101 [Eremomyces bilateralis CBS 781.70]KAF1811450.1 hypothetical protein P152DRAFT_467101 [Eremomyces bilateralis CBS 781.70]
MLSLLSSALLLSSLASAEIDCKHIVKDKREFDLSKLDGKHSVHYIRSDLPGEPGVHNTTFTTDLCHPLKDTGCPQGSRICASTYLNNDSDPFSAIPIAMLRPTDNRYLEPKWTLLSKSDANADAGKEGLRLEIGGGQDPPTGRYGKKQKAFIEFLCDPEVEGDDADKEEGKLRRREGDDDADVEDDGTDKGEGKKMDEGRSLQFVSYTPAVDEDLMVLRLEWKTKHACQSKKDSGDDKPSDHWGFFTWFLIIVFLLIASYLIFGAWLNYNRYGARGWDLLPHGDAVRDVPYLLKDFGRRIASSIQGGGSRGGYSAV